MLEELDRIKAELEAVFKPLLGTTDTVVFENLMRDLEALDDTFEEQLVTNGDLMDEIEAVKESRFECDNCGYEIDTCESCGTNPRTSADDD